MSEKTIAAIASYDMPTHAKTNRVQWQVDPKRAALLIHDMQYYFLKKYDMAQAPIPALVQNTVRIYEACKQAGVPVFYTAQSKNQTSAERALNGEFWGAGMTAPELQAQQPIIDELTPDDEDTILTKWRYSAFVRSDLEQRLAQQGRDQLIITGIYAHIGCMTTALDAFMRDIRAFFVLDATADFSAKEHQMAIDHVSQRCGVSLDTQTLIQQIQPNQTRQSDPHER